MPYYRTCPNCGAHLDPGEVCSCQNEKKAAANAANTGDGKAEPATKKTNSTLILGDNKGDVKHE